MKNIDLIIILNTINLVEKEGVDNKEKANPKFTYGLCKNRRLIQTEIKDLQEAIRKNPKFIEYNKNVQKSRIDILGEYLKEIRVEGSDHIKIKEKFGAEIKAFDEKENELKEEYADAIKEQAEIEKETRAFEQEEYKGTDLFKIKLEYFPDYVNAQFMEGLFEIVEDSTK